MNNFLKLVIPFFYGDERTYARWAGLWLLILSQLGTGFGYFFIQWNRRFYDALEAKDSELFIRECFVFTILVVSFVLVSSLNRYSCQRYALRWRVWMTRNALKSWLFDEQRSLIEGADQRIQEDLMRFTTIFERFFLESLNSVLLILLFIPLLFSQTHALYINNFHLSWILLITAITYTSIGMYVSVKIGNPLIQYEYDNQKLEAAFRYNLVHVLDGEHKSLGFFEDLLKRIVNNYHAMFNRQKYFTIWQKSYDQFSILIPFGLLASSYFAGLLTLGMLMQIKSTFSRIRNSMAYLLDHYPEFTDMLAIARRLAEFYASTQELPKAHITPAIIKQPLFNQ